MSKQIVVQILADDAQFQRNMRAAGRTADSFGAKVHGVGRSVAGLALGGGAVYALTRAIGGGERAAIAFDKSMRNVNSIAKLNERQFAALSTQVRGLAKVSGQAPKVLADGMYDLVSSGFKAADAVKVLRSSSVAATAGLTDTATATKAIVASLNAYHLGAGEAKNTSDVLFQTVNKGVLTFEELANNIGDVLPAATALNVPLTQIGGALATLTLHGVSAAESATQVKQLMFSMLKPTADLNKQLGNLGYVSAQAALAQDGLTGVVHKLSAAAGGNQAVIAKWFPNVRALSGFMGLAGKNVGLFTENVKSMDVATKGAGATQGAFAEQTKSMAFQWERMKQTIVAAVIPAFEEVTGKVADWLSKSKNQKRVTEDVTSAMNLMVDVLTKAARAVKELVKWEQKLAGLLGGQKEVLEGLIGLKVALMFRRWAGAAGMAAAETGGLAAAFSALGPAIAVATAAYIGYRALQRGQLSGAGDLMPVKRNGIWVDPNTGAPVPNQAKWNRRTAAGGGSPRPGVTSSAQRYGSASGGVYGETTLTTLTGGVVKSNRVVDCSAYIYAIFTTNGYQGFPGTSETQWSQKSGPNWTSHLVGGGESKPGDVVFMVGAPKYASPGHVGIVVSGSGPTAQVMQYYSSGRPADTIALESVTDLVGIKRFFLAVDAPAASRGSKKGGPAAKQGSAVANSLMGAIAAAQQKVRVTLKVAKQRAAAQAKVRGTYSYVQLRSLWAAAGGDPNIADVMAAVAVAESSGQSWAINHYKGHVYCGCWQIGDMHGYQVDLLLSGDQAYNASAAVDVYNAQGLSAWDTYKNGVYKKFLKGRNSPRSSGTAYESLPGDTAINQAGKAKATTAAGKRAKAQAAILKALSDETAAAAAAARRRHIDRDSVYGPWAHPHATAKTSTARAGIVSGDALLPEALRERLRVLSARFASATAQAAVLTGDAADKMQMDLLANMREQAAVIQDETAALKTKLAHAEGRQRSAIATELEKIQGHLTDVNEQILSSIQANVQTVQTRFQTVFDKVRGRLIAQFEAQTQRMLDKVAARFFQGSLTPAEAALKAWQDARSQKALNDALAAAQAQLAAASTPEERQAAQDALQAARDALEQDRLEAAAARERAAADKAYAEQSAKIQAERQAQEEALNAALDANIESILNGTGSLTDLAAIAGEYGLTLTAGAIPEMTDLGDAAGSLVEAFKDLADWIDVVLGAARGSHLGGRGNPVAPGGDSWWTKGGWWAPGLDTTGPGSPAAWMVRPRPGGTLVRLGEGRGAEMVTAAGAGRGRTVVIENITIQAHSIPDTRRFVKDVAPLLRDELRVIGG